MNAAFKPSLPVLKCMRLYATRGKTDDGQPGPVVFSFETPEIENIGEDAPNGACWSGDIVSYNAKGKKKTKRVLVSKRYHMGIVGSEYSCDGTGSASLWYDARILTNEAIVRSMLVTNLLKKAEAHLAQSKAHVSSLKGLLNTAPGAAHAA